MSPSRWWVKGTLMKIRFTIAVAIPVALAVAACGGQQKPEAPASTVSVASTASAPPVTSSTTAAPAKGDRPNKEFLVGKWGTNGDCTLAIDLRADGTSDGPFGNWLYNDGVISFADEPDFKVNVTVIDANTMASSNAQGKTAEMTRCP